MLALLALAVAAVAPPTTRIHGKADARARVSLILVLQDANPATKWAAEARNRAAQDYTWSIERLRTSQDAAASRAADAYTWSVDAARDVQSMAQQRLQTLGLLPDWLVAATSDVHPR